MSRRNPASDQAHVDVAPLNFSRPATTHTAKQGSVSTPSRLSVQPLPSPIPSPSKELDHPTYAPGSGILRAQQAAATKSFSSSSAFGSSANSAHLQRAPLIAFGEEEDEIDEEDEEETELLFERRQDDLTDYKLDRHGNSGSGPDSEAGTPRVDMFPVVPSPPRHSLGTRRRQSSSIDVGTAWTFDVDSPPAATSSFASDAWGSQRSAYLPLPASKTSLLHRLSKFFGLASISSPPDHRSLSAHRSSTTASSRRSRFSPRRVLFLLALFLGFLTLFRSFGLERFLEDPALRNVHLDMSVLGSDSVDYGVVLDAIKDSGRAPTAQEKVFLEMERKAKAEEVRLSLKGRIGALVGKIAAAAPGRKDPSGAVVPVKVAEKPKSGGAGGLVKEKKVVTVTPPPAAKKAPTGDGNLLGLDQVPRRYRYGANFQPAAQTKATKDSNSQDTSSKDEENDNAMVSEVPTEEQLAAIFAAEKTRYDEEEPFWRSFVWTAPRVHETLDNFLAKLDTDELALRDWIREMRTQPRPPAKKLGLSAMGSMRQHVAEDDSDSSSNIISSDNLDVDIEIAVVEDDVADPQAAYDPLTEPIDEETPRRRIIGRGMRRFSPDDHSSSAKVRARAKFDRKPSGSFKLRELEPADFVGGNLNKWGALMVESKDEVSGTCQGSNWLHEYQQMHEEFLAEWQTPIPLEVVFDSPFIDWSFSSFTQDQDPILSNVSSADLDIIHFDRRAMDMTFGSTSWSPSSVSRLTKGMEMRDLAFQNPWIRLFTNRGMVYRSFSYDHLQTRVTSLKLKPLTAFSCILNYLFRPKPAALGFISDYSSLFALPSVFSIGIQIRTGDASMKDPDYDLTNTLEVHSSFFKCADQLAETYAMPDQKILYYLVTDSAHLRDEAIQKLGDKVVVTGAGIEHIHQRSGHADGVFNAVLEEWILGKTESVLSPRFWIR
ncbi:hypothetical protein RQP46_003189 [Phenoliferia psychrophenolica]